MKRPSLVFHAAALSLQWTSLIEAFAPMQPNIRKYSDSSTRDPRRTKLLASPQIKEDNDDAIDTSTIEPRLAFPVISKIAGMDWTGSCRYVGAQLTPVPNLKLSGGVRYDINGTSLTLSSYLTFPEGRTRKVVMKGDREVLPPGHEVMTLRTTVKDGGPIIMRLSEVCPDTILINEVERATGKIVMTSSVSIVQGAKGLELVGVSHEVGNDATKGGVIEGHQVWRMGASPESIELKDFDYHSAAGDDVCA